jgi:hypothetical protein
VHWVARTKLATLEEARAAAASLTDYVNAHADGVSASLYVEMFGKGATLHWLVRVENLTVWDRVLTRLRRDEGYLTLERRTLAYCADDEFTSCWLTPVF